MTGLRRILGLTFLAALPALAGAQATDYWACLPGVVETGTPVLVITGPAQTAVDVIFFGVTTRYTIPAGAPLTVQLDPRLYPSSSESSSPCGLHVRSSAAIYATLHVVQFGASEATRLIPTEALGMDYMVMAYPGEAGSRSEFELVATQNGTIVIIHPATRTSGGVDSGGTISLVLNAGDVFLLQCDPNDHSSLLHDLTGSTIHASQPIAVFAGNDWTAIPGTALAFNPLYEQLMPVAAWGMHFVAIPFRNRAKGDLFRITALNDQTDVMLNGQAPIVRLKSAQTFSVIIDSIIEIRSSAPVGIAQFSHSYAYDGREGDPFMVTVPPLNLSSYSAQFEVMGDYYAHNSINVAANDYSKPVYLDGTDIATLSSTVRWMISGPGAYQVPISNGPHTLTSTGGFVTTVYGTGYVHGADSTLADGYGYTINSDTAAAKDVASPIVSISGTCRSQFAVVIADTSIPSSGIKTVNVTSASNCQVTVSSFQPCTPRVDVTVAIVNPVLASAFTLDIRDCAGNKATFSHSCSADPDTIPPVIDSSGDCADTMTFVAADSSRNDAGISTVDFVTLQNTAAWVTAPIVGCPKTVEIKAVVSNPTLPALYTIGVTDCAGNKSSFTHSCSARSDILAPRIDSSGDCSSFLAFAVTDSGPFDTGISSIRIVQATNMTVTVPPIAACQKTVGIVASVLINTLPASCTIEVTDCAGNVARISHDCPVFSDTVPPMCTLQAPCTAAASVTVLDMGLKPSGIARITVVDSFNVVITLPPTQCAQSVSIPWQRRDTLLPAWFTLLVVDCDSNATMFSDTCVASPLEAVLLAIDSVHGTPGTVVRVPIHMVRGSTTYPLVAIEFMIGFDPTIARWIGLDVEGSVLSDFTVRTNSMVPGSVGVRFDGHALPAIPTGMLAGMRFELLAGPRNSTALVIADSSVRINDQSHGRLAGRLSVAGALIVDSVCGGGPVGFAPTMFASVSPNPTRDAFSVHVIGGIRSTHVRVSTMLGVAVRDITITDDAGEVFVPISSGDLHTGPYFVTIDRGGQHRSHIVVVAR